MGGGGMGGGMGGGGGGGGGGMVISGERKSFAVDKDGNKKEVPCGEKGGKVMCSECVAQLGVLMVFSSLSLSFLSSLYLSLSLSLCLSIFLSLPLGLYSL